MSFYYPGRRRITHPEGGEMMTKQSHKAECDIHNILRQYQRTGILTHIAQQQGEFMDLPDPVDFQEALNTVQAAQDAFSALPSSVRDEFQTPEGFLAAFYDSSRHERLRELGLLKPATEPPAPPSSSE